MKKMGKDKLLLIFSLALIILTFGAILLPSCGGGGGGGGGGTQQPQPTGTYLFYFNKTTGGLFFYDPVTKATTTVEAGGITGVESKFIGGTYNAAATQTTNIHYNTIVYAKGGNLYKVSLLKSGTHTPIRVSNETGASTVCDNKDIPDLPNTDHSVYAYSVPASVSCDPATDIWKAVRLSMTSADNPMGITSEHMKPVTEIYDWSTAGIAGELAVYHTDDALVKCTTDFNKAHCPTLLTKPTGTVIDAGPLGIDINAKKIYLWVFDGTEYQVRTYGTTSNIVSDPVYTTANPITEGLQDKEAAYFGEAPHTLKKITFGTTPSVVSLFTETIVVNAQLTDNRIVYVSKEDISTGATITTYTLKSALKSDGTTTVLATASDPAFLQLVFASGSRVFYNFYDYNVVSGWTYSAGYIRDDGTGKLEVLNARWTGGTSATTLMATSGQVNLVKVIMSKSNGEVWSFDPVTYSSGTGLLLGAMPSGPPDFRGAFCVDGFGSEVLGFGYSTAGGDIFSVNVNTVNSLNRVTNTPDDEELSLR